MICKMQSIIITLISFRIDNNIGICQIILGTIHPDWSYLRT